MSESYPWLYYKYSFIHTNFEGHLFIARTLLFGVHFHQLNHKMYNPETSRRAMSTLWVSCEFFQRLQELSGRMIKCLAFYLSLKVKSLVLLRIQRGHKHKALALVAIPLRRTY